MVVLGAGSSGEHFVGALRRLDPDVEIVVVERELAGGECSYYACIPTKTLLRSGEVLAAARIAPGAAEAVTGTLDAERVFWWRDQVTDGRDDSWHANWIAEQGAELVRGEGRVLRKGVVAVGEREIEYGEPRGRDGLVAGGATRRRPGRGRVLDEPRRRLGERRAREPRRPRRGPGGCGARAVLPPAGLARDDPGEPRPAARSARSRRRNAARASGSSEEGIDVRVEVQAKRVSAADAAIRVELASGDVVEAERLLVATGRRANVEGIGLEQLGVELTKTGIAVDERMRAADGVWAIGDPSGVALLTHVGKYQARVAAANIAGVDVRRRLPGDSGGGVHRSAGGLGRDAWRATAS